MRLRPSFVLPAALLVLGACGGGGGDTSSNNNPTSPNTPNNPNPTPTGPVQTSAVDVSDDTFTPASIQVAVNTQVRWTWVQGASAHNVTVSDGTASGDKTGGDSFNKTFATLEHSPTGALYIRV